MVVTPVNDLTTYDSSTTLTGTGISIRTLSIIINIFIHAYDYDTTGGVI